MENETFYCSFVSTQFIICECGETFPSEDCLKEHLEKDHAIEKPIQLEKKEQPKVHAVPKPKTKPEKLMLHYGASGKKPVYIVKKNDENKTLVVKLEDVESSLEEHLDRHHAEEIKKEVIFEYEDNYVEEPDNEVDYAVDQHHAKGLDDQVVYELSPDDIQDGPHYVVSVDAEGSEPSDCEAPGEDSMETILEGSFNDEHCYDTKLVKVEEFYCEVCGKGFASEKSVAAHVQRIHIKPYNKKNMYKKETTIGKFKQNKNIVCEVCGKKYASNAALRYHQRVHTGEKPYHCTECPKSFAMPLFLQMHYRMHTGERPYKCSLCPKAFARKAALNRHDKIHLRTHTGERPYECPHCPKAFSNKAALLRHDRVHTGERPYVCPECNKAFTQSNSRKLHVNTVHLKMPAPYKSRARRLKALQRQQGHLSERSLAQQVEMWSGEEGVDNLVYHDDVQEKPSEVVIKEDYEDDSD